MEKGLIVFSLTSMDQMTMFKYFSTYTQIAYFPRPFEKTL